MLKIACALVALLVILAGGAVLKNKVPLRDPPGVARRLLVYLTTNSAQTRSGHEFPELRPRTYPEPRKQMFERVKQAAAGLGWTVEGADPGAYTIHAVVATPWLGFKDDVRIALEESPGHGTTVQIASRSRVGRADYGANLGHVMELEEALGAGS